MRRGADVIVQAPLGNDTWFGYADVLVKVPGDSALGDWHYEAHDTKLARETRAGAILQLCIYPNCSAKCSAACRSASSSLLRQTRTSIVSRKSLPTFGWSRCSF